MSKNPIDIRRVSSAFFNFVPKPSSAFHELFIEISQKSLLEFSNGFFLTDFFTSEAGFAFRTIDGLKQFQRCFPTVDEDFIINVIKNKNKTKLSGKSGSRISAFETDRSHLQRFKIIQKAWEKVQNKTTVYDDVGIRWQTIIRQKYCLNNIPAETNSWELYTTVSVHAQIKRHGRTVEGRATISARDERKISPDLLYRLIEKALKQAEEKESTGSIKAGEYPVLFAAGSGAVFFHETVSHLVEADYIANSLSVLCNLLNTKIGPDNLFVYDSSGDNSSPVFYKTDDEGCPAGRTALIEDGVLKNILTDRYHHINFNYPLTGNGRREGYRRLPLPRMSNTFVANGTDSSESMRQSISNGLFIESPGDANVNPGTGEFIFNGVSGNLIENGVITFPVENLMISGNVLDALKNISAIGNDCCPADYYVNCHKEDQTLPTGLAQPTIKIASLFVK